MKNETVSHEAPPTSRAVRAQARQEAAAYCAMVRAEGDARVAELRRRQAEELARAEERERSSFRRTCVASVTGVVLALAAASAVLTLSTRPTLGRDGADARVTPRSFEPAPLLARTTARAEPELGNTRRGDDAPARPELETSAPQAGCSDWDPLAFCLR